MVERERLALRISISVLADHRWSVMPDTDIFHRPPAPRDIYAEKSHLKKSENVSPLNSTILLDKYSKKEKKFNILCQFIDQFYLQNSYGYRKDW